MITYLNEIALQVQCPGPRRRPADFKTGTFQRKTTQIPGISVTSGVALKSGRREIQALRFSKYHFNQKSAESWAWRNYNILRIKEAEYNGEPFPKDLQI